MSRPADDESSRLHPTLPTFGSAPTRSPGMAFAPEDRVLSLQMLWLREGGLPETCGIANNTAAEVRVYLQRGPPPPPVAGHGALGGDLNRRNKNSSANDLRPGLREGARSVACGVQCPSEARSGGRAGPQVGLRLPARPGCETWLCHLLDGDQTCPCLGQCLRKGEHRAAPVKSSSWVLFCFFFKHLYQCI